MRVWPIETIATPSIRTLGRDMRLRNLGSAMRWHCTARTVGSSSNSTESTYEVTGSNVLSTVNRSSALMLTIVCLHTPSLASEAPATA